jgi:hypothetical protein
MTALESKILHPGDAQGLLQHVVGQRHFSEETHNVVLPAVLSLPDLVELRKSDAVQVDNGLILAGGPTAVA